MDDALAGGGAGRVGGGGIGILETFYCRRRVELYFLENLIEFLKGLEREWEGCSYYKVSNVISQRLSRERGFFFYSAMSQTGNFVRLKCVWLNRPANLGTS